MKTGLLRAAAICGALGTLVAVSAPASADTFNLATNGGDGSVTAIANGFHLFGSDAGGGPTTYTATALSNQSFNVNWIYHTDDEDGAAFDPAGFVKNGVLTQLTDNNGNDNQSGPFSFSVSTGDIYGFYIAGDGSLGRADLQVTGFAAAETPLPAALPLFATGLGALGLLGWRRKRKQAA